jgi:murein L,D-transpeptidase YcbB/YkuD
MRFRSRRKLLVVMTLAILAAVGLAIRAILPPAGSRVASDEAPAIKLVLNLAARRLYVYENGKRTQKYVVSVGMPKHRTPTGRFQISHMIWNPWWHPPNSKWARGKKPVPPGPQNPMGRVKMYFRDKYYLHGTPATSTLGQPVSHGCVRMYNRDAIALARLLLSYGAPNVSKAQIDAVVANSKKTTTMRLRSSVPLEVISHSAGIDEDRLEIDGSADELPEAVVWDDALRALTEVGFDLTTLDRMELLRVVRQGVLRPVSISIAALRLAPSSAGAR